MGFEALSPQCPYFEQISLCEISRDFLEFLFYQRSVRHDF